jgi:hypothetical protein
MMSEADKNLSRTIASEQDFSNDVLVEEVNRLMVEVARLRAEKNAAFAERNMLVAALSKVFPAGLDRHEDDGRTVFLRDVAYIDLPTGQVSWHLLPSQLPWFDHLSQYKGEWDGHDGQEKYRRLSSLEPLQQLKSSPSCSA